MCSYLAEKASEQFHPSFPKSIINQLFDRKWKHVYWIRSINRLDGMRKRRIFRGSLLEPKRSMENDYKILEKFVLIYMIMVLSSATQECWMMCKEPLRMNSMKKLDGGQATLHGTTSTTAEKSLHWTHKDRSLLPGVERCMVWWRAHQFHWRVSVCRLLFRHKFYDAQSWAKRAIISWG